MYIEINFKIAQFWKGTSYKIPYCGGNAMRKNLEFGKRVGWTDGWRSIDTKLFDSECTE
jgi:hypothetical protein